MLTSFVPAGEILGVPCQVRNIVLADSPLLPGGDYVFLDTYCTDNTCDCRKTIIQVLRDGELVSIVNYGWESPAFYQRWMGSASGDDLAEEMSGLSIDFTSPNRVSPEGILTLMNHLLDQKWISLLKEHYRLIRASSKRPSLPARAEKIPRNNPCPCGSGKKHKNCCQ